MTKKKSIRERAIDELLPHLLPMGKSALTSLEYKILTEVLLHGKTFADLSKTLKLTVHRQAQIFEGAITRLINTVNDMEPDGVLAGTLQTELDKTREELAEVRFELENTNRELDEKQKKLGALVAHEKLPAKARAALDLLIDDTELSARVKGICSRSSIYKVRQLIQFSKSEFLNLRNCGEQSANEVQAFLLKKGLNWKMSI